MIKLVGLRLFIAALIAFVTIQMQSCQYDYILIDDLDPSIPVGFAEQILPIFEENDCTSCHNSNYTEIDFTEGNAYETIFPALIDSINIDSSRIYLYPNPSHLKHQYKKYSPEQAALVLLWLEQGALNN